MRVLAWRESDVDDYLHHFPHSPLTASTEPFVLPPADEDEQAAARSALETAFGTDVLDAFVEDTETQSLVVIEDDRIVAEQYGDGWRRDSLLTSFSVAKSFVSTLLGFAIAEWVALASGTDPAGRAPTSRTGRHYGLMWWGWDRPGQEPDYAAWGDHGQFVFVSPAHDVVIVRNGVEAGIPEAEWIDGFVAVAESL